MAIKFLHTADWQIGQKATHVASAANVVRRARLDSARAVVDAANRENVDAVVLAGDQFEDNLVDDKLVHAVVEILAGAHAPVLVLPGNHDALSHDSIYFRASWRNAPSHVRLVQTYDPIEIAGARFFPAPIFQKKSAEDPTAKMISEGDAIRIGLAHGSLRIEGKFSEDDFPIALDAHRRLGFDYLALGHWHGHFVHDGRVVYPGTQETCNFGERNSGQAFVVEIASRGAAPKLTEVRTGQLKWLTEEVDFDLGTETALRLLRGRLSAIESPERALVRVRTRGQSGANVPVLLDAFRDEWEEKLLFFNVERGDVPSARMEGELAAMAARFPLVESLLDGIELRGLPPEETSASLQLLFEILQAEAR